MSKSQISVVVVGAGIAGLSTAHHLLQAGFSKVTILEASNRLNLSLSLCAIAVSYTHLTLPTSSYV